MFIIFIFLSIFYQGVVKYGLSNLDLVRDNKQSENIINIDNGTN